MKLSKHLPDFQRYLETSTRLLARSRTRYMYEVTRFAHALGDPEVAEVTPTHLLRWHAGFHDRGSGPNTVNQIKAALKWFFRFLDEFLEVPQAANLLKVLQRLNTPAAAQSRQSFALSDTEFQRLKQVAAAQRGTGPRDAAMLHFAWDTATRRAEIVGVKLDDIDLELRMAQVTGRGNKPRTVFFTEECREVLEDWLLVRERWGPHCDHLFINATGGPLSGERLGHIVQQVGRRAGFPNGVWTHILRHSGITHWLENDMPIQDAAALAGHSSVDTTFHYTHQRQSRLRQAYDAANPKREQSASTS